MMNELNIFFEERKTEINSFFDFLEIMKIDITTEKVITIDDNRSMKVSNDLQQIFKSQCILMLYNLIEGTVNKGIEYIFNAVNDKSLKYEDVHEKIKVIWYKHHVPKLLNFEIDSLEHPAEVIKFIENKYLTQIALDLAQFRKKNGSYFSAGTLDSKAIRETILKSRFGIPFSGGEDALKEIKRIRNNLAHGEISYSNCTQYITFSDILTWKDKTYTFLGSYVNAIETYVTNESYKTQIVP